jgi:hypothetical protein
MPAALSACCGRPRSTRGSPTLLRQLWSRSSIVAAVRRWAGHGASALFGLALLGTTNARAQQPSANAAPIAAVIEIERAPGSEACPDTTALFRSIEHLFPERQFQQASAASESTARARVTIRPQSPGHEAVLTLLAPRHGERVIREQDPDCRGLADALALAFVMLIAPPMSSADSASAGAAANPNGVPATASAISATPQAKPPEPAADTRAPDRVPEPRRTARAFRAAFGASLAGGIGVLSEPALGAGGELELFHERGFGLSLQGLRLWAQPAEAEGGSVTLTLWGLLAGPCYRQRLSRTAHVDACLRFGLGSQHANVQGFVAPESGSFPWQVLVPSISYRQGLPGLAQLLSAFARVGFVGQLRPQSFSVRQGDASGDRLPIASAPKFGLMADIGLMFSTGPF